jgi:hypothetical protein
MEAEDRLAVNLTQLEMGYPLDGLGADLPEQEARLLHLAASLQKTAFPVEDDTAVLSQRAQLLRAAEQLYPRANTVTPTAPASFWRVLNSF